jgi:hypothetical protein
VPARQYIAVATGALRVARVLDGVVARDATGTVRFHPARRLTTLDVAEVLAALEPRRRRLLDAGRHADMDHEGHADEGRYLPASRSRRCGGSGSENGLPLTWAALTG